jgi:hypothetical protein
MVQLICSEFLVIFTRQVVVVSCAYPSQVIGLVDSMYSYMHYCMHGANRSENPQSERAYIPKTTILRMFMLWDPERRRNFVWIPLSVFSAEALAKRRSSGSRCS